MKLETNRGPILIESIATGPRTARHRFHHLVRAGYYDDSRFFRVVKGRWAQFGINGDPKIASLWRDADDSGRPEGALERPRDA